jgi:tetratricopeptide (TPR) repeat protein
MQRGDSLTISTELVDARDNSHIWGQQYDRKLADVIALREEIAKEMTTALRMRLTGEDQKRLAKSYTANPEAYQDYLKGRYWEEKRSEEGSNKSIDFFQQAIAKDPSYALAYAHLAESYTIIADIGMVSPKEAYPKAKEAALKALEIDDTLPEAHSSLAAIKTFYDWDWPGGEKEYKRAIELSPNSPDAHGAYGFALAFFGRPEDAIIEDKRTLELDPLSLPSNRNLGNAFYFARQYDQAIEQCRKTLDLDPSFITAHTLLALAYVQKSMHNEGIAEFEKALSISPGYPIALSGLGYAYARAGRSADAQNVLDQLNELSKRRRVPAVS